MKRSYRYLLIAGVLVAFSVFAHWVYNRHSNSHNSSLSRPSTSAVAADDDPAAVVDGQPDFDVHVSPNSFKIKSAGTRPARTKLTFTISGKSGFHGPVDLFAVAMNGDNYSQKLPAGVRVAFPRQSFQAGAGSRNVIPVALFTDASALRYPGTYTVSLVAAQGKMNRRADLQILIPALSETSACRLDTDEQEIDTEHSGRYDVQITMKAAAAYPGKVKLSLCENSVDDILSAKPSSSRITYSFEPPEISMAHPKSKLHLGVPPAIPEGGNYHLIIEGKLPDGKRILKSVAVCVTMNDYAVINSDDGVVRRSLSPPLFSRDWFAMFQKPQGNPVPAPDSGRSVKIHLNVVPQEVMTQLYAQSKTGYMNISHPVAGGAKGQ